MSLITPKTSPFYKNFQRCNLLYASDPSPVKNVTVELRQGTDTFTAVLSWQQPGEPNGVITQYQVFYAGYNGTQVYNVVYVAVSNQVTLCEAFGVTMLYNCIILKVCLINLLEAQRIW